ncbi:MAG: hypothetical protein GKR91_15880 [Pseudomonadales bacterium]|nr:hypothetical protein [Pseudomonadales bacterium]
METMDVRSMVFSKLAEHTTIDQTESGADNNQQFSDLNLDSLAILEVLYDIEDYYSITVDSSELQKLTTVNDLITIVNNSLANAA